MNEQVMNHLLSELTDMEIELVQGIADDKSSKDIAKLKGLSPRTIETKTFLLKKRFGLRTNRGLITLFFRRGLIK